MNLPLLQNDRETIPGFGTGELVKETISICPDCLVKIPAFVTKRGEQVFLE